MRTDENRTVYVGDIQDEKVRDATIARIVDIRSDLWRASDMMNCMVDLNAVTFEELKEVQRLVTDAHWNINNVHLALNEIRKGRQM